MKKHNEGFSLIETVVAIAILGLIVVPCCSALLMSIRINEKAQQMMHAQLAVSSAVETLMAEGIAEASANYDLDEITENGTKKTIDRFPDVEIKTEVSDTPSCYDVTVVDNGALVEITTTIRAKEVGG